MGVGLIIGRASIDTELGPAFSKFAADGVGAVLIGSDPVLTNARSTLIALSLALKLPTLSETSLAPENGAFAGYGPNNPEAYWVAGDSPAAFSRATNPRNCRSCNRRNSSW